MQSCFFSANCSLCVLFERLHICVCLYVFLKPFYFYAFVGEFTCLSGEPGVDFFQL